MCTLWVGNSISHKHAYTLTHRHKHIGTRTSTQTHTHRHTDYKIHRHTQQQQNPHSCTQVHAPHISTYTHKETSTPFQQVTCAEDTESLKQKLIRCTSPHTHTYTQVYAHAHTHSHTNTLMMEDTGCYRHIQQGKHLHIDTRPCT